MARTIVYIVQAFIAGKNNRLVADRPIACKTQDAAHRTALRLTESKIGVVAFASSGDSDLGEYDDEPSLIFKAGRLPEQFDEFTYPSASDSAPG